MNECLNESPSKKEGKLLLLSRKRAAGLGLNESPSKKEGKFAVLEDGKVVLSEPQ